MASISGLDGHQRIASAGRSVPSRSSSGTLRAAAPAERGACVNHTVLQQRAWRATSLRAWLVLRAQVQKVQHLDSAGGRGARKKGALQNPSALVARQAR